MRNAVAVIIGAVLALTGCQWHTLSIPTSDPVYLGSYSSTRENMADSVGTLEGYYIYEKGSGVYVQGKTSSFGAGGGEEELRLIESAIADALEDKPNRFVSDIEVRVHTRTGYSGWGLLMGIIGESIVKGSDETDYQIGLDESFIIKATVWEVKRAEIPDE